MRRVEGKPPSNALNSGNWNAISKQTKRTTFEVLGGDGKSRTISVANNCLRVLDCLTKRPLYCASRARISQEVSTLKHRYGLDIETLLYRNDPQTGRKTYGVYFLRSKVKRVDAEVTA